MVRVRGYARICFKLATGRVRRCPRGLCRRRSRERPRTEQAMSTPQVGSFYQFLQVLRTAGVSLTIAGARQGWTLTLTFVRNGHELASYTEPTIELCVEKILTDWRGS